MNYYCDQTHNNRRILDDLSSADATLKAAGTDPLALAAAATLQAQQVEYSKVSHPDILSRGGRQTRVLEGWHQPPDCAAK